MKVCNGDSPLLSAQGSVYVCGYDVEGRVNASDGRPSLACWRQMRQLHDGQVYGRVCTVLAGLNYLIALNSDNRGLVWGKLELPHYSKQRHSPSNVSLCDFHTCYRVNIFPTYNVKYYLMLF